MSAITESLPRAPDSGPPPDWKTSKEGSFSDASFESGTKISRGQKAPAPATQSSGSSKEQDWRESSYHSDDSTIQASPSVQSPMAETSSSGASTQNADKSPRSKVIGLVKQHNEAFRSPRHSVSSRQTASDAGSVPNAPLSVGSNGLDNSSESDYDVVEEIETDDEEVIEEEIETDDEEVIEEVIETDDEEVLEEEIETDDEEERFEDYSESVDEEIFEDDSEGEDSESDSEEIFEDDSESSDSDQIAGPKRTSDSEVNYRPVVPAPAVPPRASSPNPPSSQTSDSSSSSEASSLSYRLSKDPSYLRNPPYWCLCIMVILVLGAGAGAGYGILLAIDTAEDSSSPITPSLRGPSRAPSPTPVSFQVTPSPTTRFVTPAPTNLELDVLNYLSERVGSAVSEFGTPQYKAATWLINEDPSSLVTQRPLDQARLLQRFLMAYFYYAHSNSGFWPWVSCNPPNIVEDEAGSDPSACTFQMPIALLENGSLQYSQVRGVRWLSIAHECDWQGVSCAVIDIEDEVMLAVERITLGTPLILPLQLQ